jgi:hypothetical protein
MPSYTLIHAHRIKLMTRNSRSRTTGRTIVLVMAFMMVLSPMVGTVAFTGTASAAPGDALYRANAGGSFTADSTTWDALQTYQVAGEDQTSTHGQPNSLDASVPTGTPSQIWDVERWDPGGGEEMQFEFAVPSGQQVEVRLYFYDGFGGTSNVGDRVFDVSIEGQTVLDNFDIIETYGDQTGAMESFTVTSDGTIDVDFGHVTENPQINAIEIIEVGPQPGVLGGPDAVDFGTVVTGNSATETVTVTNLGESGDADITVSDVSITGGDATDFSDDFSGSTTLAPGQSLDVQVTFSPTDAQAKGATLAFTHDAPNTASPLTVDLSGEGSSSVPVGFGESQLQGFGAGGLTALEFGPDGRLYVAQQGGTIYALEIERNGPNSYSVVNQESIGAINDIPNHDDDGTLNTNQNNRQVTGLTVGGTAAQPVVYVTSSDPRIGGGGSGTELDLDTNSGTVSRLTFDWNSDGSLASVVHDVLVMGLPRSEENHAPNGLDLSDDGTILYLAQGGNTNKGAPSNNFAYTAEYALSSAALTIDLAQIEAEFQPKDLASYSPVADSGTYDSLTFYYAIPTIQNDDATDGDDLPFGGQDGVNMAKIVENGPVQVFSSGYRNPYDLVLSEDGQLYVIDNGPNGGWGGQPVDEGYSGSGDAVCTNQPNEDGSYSTGDQLHLATEGSYGGHAVPIRANPTGADIYDENGNMVLDITLSNSPVPASLVNPIECDYQDPTEDNSIGSTFGWTGGIEEYTASNFGGEIQGDLLVVESGSKVERVALNAAGDDVIEQEDSFLTPGTALGIEATGDEGPFPGTVWTARGDLYVYEPNDYDGSTGTQCTGADDPSLDEDGDGYDNADEIDAGTDPCSAASSPEDFDDDGTSNLNDPDDDNDGTPDTSDPFAVDPDDGTTTTLPVLDDLTATMLFGENSQAWTGLMTNGQTDYQDLYAEDPGTVGGAAGALLIEDISAGDATQNNQENAFQFGATTPDEPFVVSTTVNGFPASPSNFQGIGLFVGTGDQDNYVKLVVAANGGNGGIQLFKETNGQNSQIQMTTDGAVTGPDTNTNLYLTVDPTTDPNPTNGVDEVAVSAEYSVGDGPRQAAGSGAMPASWLDSSDGTAPAFGIISTSYQSGSTFDGTWKNFYVQTVEAANNQPPTADAGPDQTVDEGTQVTLDASGSSDPDGDQLGFSWVQTAGPDVSFDIQDTDTPSFTAPAVSSDTTLTFEVTVSDGLAVDSDTVSVVVQNTDVPADGEVVYRVNAGGAEVPATDGGPAWSADTAAAPSQYLNADGDNGLLTYSTGDSITLDGSVPTSTPTSVFQSERYDVDTAGSTADDVEMLWSFPVTQGETYEVRLYFAEIFLDSSNVGTQGPRTFDVLIEGETALDDYNIYQQFGHDVGVMEAYEVTPTDGTIDVEFLHVQENPKVSAIEVVKVGSTGDLTVAEAVAGYDDGDDTINLNEVQQAINWYSTGTEVPGTGGQTISLTEMQQLINLFSTGGTVGSGQASISITDTTVTSDSITVTWDGTAAQSGDHVHVQLDDEPYVGLQPIDGSYTFENVAAGDHTVSVAVADQNHVEYSNPEASDSVTVTVEAAGGTLIAAVNAGGPAYTAQDGTEYVSDSNFAGSFSGSSGTASTTLAIANTDDDTLYQTERYGDPLSYSLPVTDGTYEVTLQFAEIYHTSQTGGAGDDDGAGDGEVGDRVFDVVIEGQTVLTDYDIFAEVGGLTATDETFTVQVTDGTLNIEMPASTDFAKLSAFTVVESSDGGPSGTTSADVTVNAGAGLSASTYTGGSMVITNTGDEPISSVTIDLSESLIPDAVFDPQGTAGDDGAKGLTIDGESGGDGSVGVVSTADGDVFSQPQNGVDGADGYKVLTVEFGDFEPGETVSFSVDIDPTTIKGVSGTGGEGSVSGLELSGSAVTVTSASATVSNDLFTDGSAGGAQSSVSDGASAAPTLGVDGVTLQSTDFPAHEAATVTGPSQTLTLSGPAGATVELLTVAASAPPSDGYDVDAFEADNAEAVSTQQVTLDASGQATVAVTLSETNLNYFQAAVQDGSGATGAVSQTVVLVVAANAAPTLDAIADQTVVTGETVTVPVTASDTDGDAPTLTKTSGPAFVTLTDAGDGTGTFEIDPTAADAGTYTVEVTADDGTDTAVESFQLTVDTATSVTAGTVAHRVNAGSSTTLMATDGGPDWTGVGGTASPYLVAASGGNYNGGDAVTPGAEVPSSTPAGVYDAERYGTMTWEFDMTAGSEVEVRLYLSNQFPQATSDGDRQFNVSVEGDQVLTQYDPVQDVGHATGTVKAFAVTENGDGTVTVEFSVGANENPQVNAIEIVETSSSGGS